MTRHAFADESRRAGYLVCAVEVGSRDLVARRKELNGLRKGGQSRIHMKSEGPARRRELLSAVRSMGVSAHIYEASPTRGGDRQARDECLTALVRDLAPRRVQHLVLESCDQDADDRRVIAQSLRQAGLDGLQYAHSRPSSECLLWLPDMLAWAYGRGGDWRRRTEGMIVNVRSVAA